MLIGHAFHPNADAVAVTPALASAVRTTDLWSVPMVAVAFNTLLSLLVIENHPQNFASTFSSVLQWSSAVTSPVGKLANVTVTVSVVPPAAVADAVAVAALKLGGRQVVRLSYESESAAADNR